MSSCGLSLYPSHSLCSSALRQFRTTSNALLKPSPMPVHLPSTIRPCSQAGADQHHPVALRVRELQQYRGHLGSSRISRAVITGVHHKPTCTLRIPALTRPQLRLILSSLAAALPARRGCAAISATVHTRLHSAAGRCRVMAAPAEGACDGVQQPSLEELGADAVVWATQHGLVRRHLRFYLQSAIKGACWQRAGARSVIVLRLWRGTHHAHAISCTPQEYCAVALVLRKENSERVSSDARRMRK